MMLNTKMIQKMNAGHLMKLNQTPFKTLKTLSYNRIMNKIKKKLDYQDKRSLTNKIKLKNINF